MSAFSQSLARTTPALRGLLGAWGVSTPGGLSRLFSYEELEAGTFYDVVAETRLELTTDDIDNIFLEFLELLEIAKRDARRESEISAQAEVYDISLRAERIKRRRLAESFESRFKDVERSNARETPPPKPPRRLGEAMARSSAVHDGDPKGRQHAEDKRRELAVEKLVEALYYQNGGDRGKLRLAAAGRRASTLEKQLGAWRRFRVWMRARFGRDRLEDSSDWIAYLEDRAAEPCGRTVFVATLGLVHFMDGASGRVGSEAHANCPVLKCALKELQYRLESSGERALRTQALRPPLSLLKGLESFILDGENFAYDRAFVWFYLISVWGVLRFDDHRGFIPSRALLDDTGFSVELVRTKTTGAGKHQQSRTVHVSSDAYLGEPDWMPVGYAAFIGLGFVNRDYALVCRGGDSTILEREITYEEYIGHLRRITSGVIVKTGIGSPENRKPFGEVLGGVLTAHSWRSFLPSAALGVGATQADLDSLGSWRPKGGMVYARQSERRASELQSKVATMLRKGATSFLNETAEKNTYERRLHQKGWSDAEVEQATKGVFDEGKFGEQGTRVEAQVPSSVNFQAEPISSLPSVRQSKIPAGENGYVLSLVRRGKHEHRKLHYLGQCHLVPGVDYLRYEWMGPEKPGVSFYDSVCTRCWPNKEAGPDGHSSSSSGESVDSH